MRSAETFCRQQGLTKPSGHTMIRRLAKALAATYNVPSGDELVLILGDGSESNNLSAIETWVRNRMLNPDEILARDILSHLVCRLGETLEQWEVQRW